MNECMYYCILHAFVATLPQHSGVVELGLDGRDLPLIQLSACFVEVVLTTVVRLVPATLQTKEYLVSPDLISPGM